MDPKSSVTDVTTRRGKFGHRDVDTGRALDENRDRDWGCASTSRGTPRIARLLG